MNKTLKGKKVLDPKKMSKKALLAHIESEKLMKTLNQRLMITKATIKNSRDLQSIDISDLPKVLKIGNFKGDDW